MEPSYPQLASDLAVDGQKPLTVPETINGEDMPLDRSFDVISPYTGARVWSSSDAAVSDAVYCVEAAEAAFPTWSTAHPSERRRILLKAADLYGRTCGGNIRNHAHRNGSQLRGQSGFRDTSFYWYAARLCSQDYDDSRQNLGARPGRASCNDLNALPVFSSRAMGAPLAAGCTVVVKAPDITPRCYYAVAKCYIDAGVPSGALSLISCRPEAAAKVMQAIIECPAVRKIHFTGSTNVGRRVAVVCAQNLKPCIKELGGKSPSIVLDDANLETAAVQCILGSFLNHGQICMCTGRIIVEAKVADQFQAVFSAILGKTFLGNHAPPTLVSSVAKDRIEQMVADAKSKGASILEGSWAHQSGRRKFSGTVVTPITVSDEEEAIKLANSMEYGPAASIITEDLRRGLRVAKRIDTDQVHINSMTIQDEPSMPFGGVKASGWGRFHNQEGMEEFLTTKSITWME